MGFTSSVLRNRGSIGEYGVDADIDNLPNPGVYRLLGALDSGTWPTDTYGVLLYIEIDGYAAQLGIMDSPDNTPALWFRNRINKTWRDWRKL